MSADHHTPLAVGGPLTQAAMEAPLGQLDAAISAVVPLETVETVVIHRSDDLAAVASAAIAAATGALRILLPDTDGAYLLGDQIVIDRDNVTFEGAASGYNPPSDGRTWIFVYQDISGPAFLWSKGVDDGTSASVISGGGMARINLDGNSTTGDGIGVITGRGQRFADLSVVRFGGACIRTGSGDVDGDYDATVDCHVADVYVQTSGSGTGILLDENTYSCSLTDVKVAVTGDGAIGIDLAATDDVWLDRYFVITQHAGATGIRLGAADYGAADGAGGAAGSDVLGAGWVGGSGTHIRALGDGKDITARRNLILGIGTEDLGRPRIVADVGAFPSFLDVEGRHNLRHDLGRAAHASDDFIAGVAGQLGWTAQGTVTARAGEANHPGILRISTGGSSGTLAGLTLGSGSGIVVPADGFIAEFIFRATQTDANTMMRVGLLGTHDADPATAGIWLEKVYGDSGWFAVCRTGSAQTRSGSLGSVSAGAWVNLTIRRHNDAEIAFELGSDGLVNGNSSARISAHVPTAALIPGFTIKNQTAADKSMDVDAFQLLLIGLDR